MKAHPFSGFSEADVNVIHATGEDPTAGDFFVVMTLQETAPAEVKIEGAQTRVGVRVLSFDSERVVLK